MVKIQAIWGKPHQMTSVENCASVRTAQFSFQLTGWMEQRRMQQAYNSLQNPENNIDT